MEYIGAMAVMGLVVLFYELLQRAAKHGVVGSYSLSPETRRKAQTVYKVVVRLVSVAFFVGFGLIVREIFTARVSGGPSIFALIYLVMLIVALGVTLVGGFRSLMWGSKEIQQMSAVDKPAASPERE